MRRTVTLEQLLQFNRSLNPTNDWRTRDLGNLGLIMEPGSTLLNDVPSNTTPFARTGGDWVTYCFLQLPGIPQFEQPIVMIVPSNPDNRSVIVGENLFDFLCLGCELGYFFCDVFTYKPKEFFEIYGNAAAHLHDHVPDPPERKVLQLLRTQFGLTPWKHVQQHMAELRSSYRRLVKKHREET